MFSYLIRRLLQGLFVIWGVYTLAFFAVHLAPGDPFAQLQGPKMQPEDIERLRRSWGYDRSVLERYLLQIRKMFWADREVHTTHVEGRTFVLEPGGDGNQLRAFLPEPPAEVLIEPTPASLEDDGAEPILLRRDTDGNYGPQPIRPGNYTLDLESLRVRIGENSEPAVAYAFGVRIEALGGSVRGRPVLHRPPPSLTLHSDEGREIILTREGDARSYASVRAAPGSYWLEGAESSPRAIVVPEEPLSTGGPTFDLGTSVLQKQPVTSYLAAPLVNTLILATAALLFNFLAGILLGVISAVRQHGKLDLALTLSALFAYSMPSFWFGLMLMLFFSVELQLLPAEGMNSVGQTWYEDLPGFLDMLHHLVLPAIVLGIGGAAATARYQRSALAEVLEQDYVRTARAKGLSEGRVIWKHAVRNSLLPVITLIGLSLPFLVSGSVITETIFSWPGMGREAIYAIKGRDVFVVTGITLIATTMVVVGNLLADLLYAWIDPRVRLR